MDSHKPQQRRTKKKDSNKNGWNKATTTAMNVDSGNKDGWPQRCNGHLDR